MASILFTVFLDLLGFGIVIPILPYYSQNLGADAWDLGVLMMSFSFMQFIFSPFWGSLSDRYGRKPMLLLTLLGNALALIFCGLTTSFVLLLLARILSGFFSSNLAIAIALISDVTTEKERPRAMGLVGAAFGVGFILGPALGGLLSQHHIQTPFFAAAFLTVLNVILAQLQIREPQLTPQERSQRRKRLPRFSYYIQVISRSNQRTPIILFLLLTLAVTQMEVTFALYFSKIFNFSAAHAGLLLGAMGIVMALVQGGAIGKLSARFSSARLTQVGLGICAIGLSLFAGSGDHLTLAIVSLLILALGHGLAHPSLNTLATLSALKSERGLVVGVFQSSGSLARILGPPLAGWAFTIQPTLPYWQGVIFLTIGFCLTFSNAFLKQHERTDKDPVVLTHSDLQN